MPARSPAGTDIRTISETVVGKREDKTDQDGHKEGFDITKTKDIDEAGGGKHDKNDRDERR